MTDKPKKFKLMKYDADAQDYEEVVPKNRADKLLDSEIEKRLKDKFKIKPTK
jgi:hypothetical protein